MTPTVIGEIKRHFRDKGWAIRVPRRLQELNVAVNRALDSLSAKLGRSPSVADLAKELGATDEEIIEAQELGQAYAPLSLDVEVAGDNDRKSATLMDHLGREDPDMKLLEDKDWSDIGRTIRHIEDPLFGSTAEARYAALRHHIAKEARNDG